MAEQLPKGKRGSPSGFLESNRGPLKSVKSFRKVAKVILGELRQQLYGEVFAEIVNDLDEVSIQGVVSNVLVATPFRVP
jgi:hypothetical protein